MTRIKKNIVVLTLATLMLFSLAVATYAVTTYDFINFSDVNAVNVYYATSSSQTAYIGMATESKGGRPAHRGMVTIWGDFMGTMWAEGDSGLHRYNFTEASDSHKANLVYEYDYGTSTN